MRLPVEPAAWRQVLRVDDGRGVIPVGDGREAVPAVAQAPLAAEGQASDAPVRRSARKRAAEALDGLLGVDGGGGWGLKALASSELAMAVRRRLGSRAT